MVRNDGTPDEKKLLCIIPHKIRVPDNWKSIYMLFFVWINTVSDMYELQSFKLGQLKWLIIIFPNTISVQRSFIIILNKSTDLEVTVYAADFNYDTVQSTEYGKYVPPVPVASLE